MDCDELRVKLSSGQSTDLTSYYWFLFLLWCGENLFVIVFYVMEALINWFLIP